jgi:hypothetical protein
MIYIKFILLCTFDYNIAIVRRRTVVCVEPWFTWFKDKGLIRSGESWFKKYLLIVNNLHKNSYKIRIYTN